MQGIHKTISELLPVPGITKRSQTKSACLTCGKKVSCIFLRSRLKHTVEHHLSQLLQVVSPSWRVPVICWQVAGLPELRGILLRATQERLPVNGEPLTLSSLVKSWLPCVPPRYTSMATLSVHIIQCLEREGDHQSYLWEARKYRMILEDRKAQVTPITPQSRRSLSCKAVPGDTTLYRRDSASNFPVGQVPTGGTSTQHLPVEARGYPPEPSLNQSSGFLHSEVPATSSIASAGGDELGSFHYHSGPTSSGNNCIQRKALHHEFPGADYFNQPTSSFECDHQPPTQGLQLLHAWNGSVDYNSFRPASETIAATHSASYTGVPGKQSDIPEYSYMTQSSSATSRCHQSRPGDLSSHLHSVSIFCLVDHTSV